MPRFPLLTPAVPPPAEGMPLLSVLRRAGEHPVEILVRRWSWESAVFSSFFRGLIFFTVNLKAGWRVRAAMMVR